MNVMMAHIKSPYKAGPINIGGTINTADSTK